MQYMQSQIAKQQPTADTYMFKIEKRPLSIMLMSVNTISRTKGIWAHYQENSDRWS